MTKKIHAARRQRSVVLRRIFSFGLRHSFVIRHSGFVIFPGARTMAKMRRVVARNPLAFFAGTKKRTRMSCSDNRARQEMPVR
jgi:hypothetical protein